MIDPGVLLTYPWGLAQRAWSLEDGAHAMALVLWTGLALQIILTAYPKPMKLRAGFILLLAYPAMLLVSSVGALLRGYGVIASDSSVFWVLAVGLFGLALYLAASQKAWLRGPLLTLLLLPHAGLMLMAVNERFWPADMVALNG